MMITDKELLEYIDGSLSKNETLQVREVLDRDPEIRRRYEALLTLDNALSRQPESNPSTSFTDHVMANLNKRLSVDYNNFWKKNLIIVISIVIIGLVGAVILLANSSFIEIFPKLQPQEITFSERTINLDPGKLNFFNQDLFIKGIIYLNAFLALFLLERAVFRPLFKHKRQTYSL